MREQAIWFPFWYELDQSIQVDEVREFFFFHEPPANVANDGLPVFYHGIWGDRERYHAARKRIIAISHEQLGAIERIDARGLDYTLTLSDGRSVKVEAEEEPGTVYGLEQQITDWRIFVEMEAV